MEVFDIMKKVLDLLTELHPDYDYAHSDDFVRDGLIDSLDLMRLVSLIEENYGVRIGGTDIMPMNFTSLASIGELLKGYGVEDAV